MKAYLHIIKMEFLSIMEYRANLMMGPFAVLSNVFIQCLIWKLVLDTNHATTLNGMTYSDFVVYSVVAFVVHQLRSSWETNFEIISDIRQGNVTRFLTRPLSFYWNYFAVWVGRNSGFFVIYIVLLLALTLVFPAQLFQHFWQLPAFIAALIASVLVSHTIHMILVTTNFWFSDVESLIVAYNLFGLMLYGSLIPYSFYPKIIVRVLTYSPFPYLVFLPTQIARGAHVPLEALQGIGMSLVWFGILGIGFRLLYWRAIRAYGAYGG